MMGELGLYGFEKNRWTIDVDMEALNNDGSQERNVALFLNKIHNTAVDLLVRTRDITVVIPKEGDRIWTGYFAQSTQESEGAILELFPDGLNIPVDNQDWWHAHAGLAIRKVGRTDMAANLKHLENIARNILSVQDDRRFVIGISITGWKFMTCCFDRSGCARTPVMDMNNEGSALTLIRALAGIRLAPKFFLGYDATISTDSDGQRRIKYGPGEDEHAKIIKTAYLTRGIRTRATAIYECEADDGTKFAIKDSWVDISGTYKEHELLRLANEKGLEGVPQLLSNWVVCNDG
ncbi:hypothetical protein BDV98DRAFT_418795 [Pterulicium gracile]|uniref:Fungal-type protein kinase domain-containing protein n=1 Tax=Pterulicium gracile TaxID=1884261 RepID=A0A5C3QRN8_9AGAR|nr:hypothetical protein BDV98DRAFT_418795 [Pterula gracilis]